jgi:hypothetical protein
MKPPCSTTMLLMVATGACLLLSVGWAQQPKPGGTLRVAWEQGGVQAAQPRSPALHYEEQDPD